MEISRQKQNKLFVFLFLTLLKTLAQNELDPNVKNDSSFIVFSSVGISDHSIASVLISKLPLGKIAYKKNDFELHLKYGNQYDIVLDPEHYCELFRYLNVRSKCHPRDSGFVFKYTLIIDFRDHFQNSEDCEIISIKEIPNVLHFLRSLKCYLQNHAFDKGLVDAIENMYLFYIKTYDKQGNMYIDTLECP